jgi:hypothetical protein
MNTISNIEQIIGASEAVKGGDGIVEICFVCRCPATGRGEFTPFSEFSISFTVLEYKY